MSREVHVRICEGVGVRLPRATRLVIGIVGSIKEARGIMKAVRTFTETELNLSINEEKSRVSKTAILGPNSLTGFWIQDVKAVSLMPGGPALSGK